jgi:hypothetical protein
LGSVVSADRKQEHNPGAAAISDDDTEAFQHPKRVAIHVPNPHMMELESLPGLDTIGVSDPCHVGVSGDAGEAWFNCIGYLKEPGLMSF